MPGRHARTPDCAYPGCTLAARRLGLCRRHAEPVPLELSTELAAACARESHELRRIYERRALNLAIEAVKRKARAA